MASIELEVGGRKYTLACRDGEEEHLRSVAAMVDRKAREAAGALGSLGEARQLLFASLLLADELKEKGGGAPAPAAPAANGAVADALEDLAARVEMLADRVEEAAAAPKLLVTGTARYELSNIPEAILTSSGAVPARALARSIWLPPDVEASEDIPANGHGGPVTPNKAALRAEALARRKTLAAALSPALRANLEAKLADRVLPQLLTARVVAGYHPLRDEISPYPILAGLGPAQTAALPWFADRGSRMIFRAAPADGPGPWGVLQPSGDAAALAPDLVLVPLVLADRAGTRIGHGKGHYDRALFHLRAAGPVFTIGLAWEEQIADQPIEPDPWDVPLDAIATPREWIACGG